jgi:YidC/Oxa1 family membrane protein insertase
MDIFQILFYIPVFNILIILYRLFSENLGLALIGIAILSRLITIPLTSRQIQMSEKNKEFQEKYNQLKKKHANDKEKLTQEAAKLQAEYLPAQLGGCLPLILQLILFVEIYSVLRAVFSEGASAFNSVAWPFVSKFAEGATINGNFLGNWINLGASPASIGLSNFWQFLPYALLIIAVVVTQYYSTKVLSGIMNNKKKETEVKKDKKKTDKPAEPDMAEMLQSSTQSMNFILPIFIGIISFSSPSGLTLYWTVQSTFVIIQGLLSNKDYRDKISQIFKRKDNGNIKTD